MTFPCSDAARSRGDDPAGTASTVRAFLLLEHDGAWGTDALRDARLPEGLGPILARRCAEAGVRPLLIRRGERRSDDTTGHRVYAAHTDASHPRLETAVLDDLRDLLHTDLSMLRQLGSLGWEPVAEPLFAVCTHGKHDRCCAVRGRPVAAALRTTEPDCGWEVSHLGGDRFAANLLVLPHGLYYGGIEADEVADLTATHRRGELNLDRLRGRSCWPMPVQYAEIALRRELGVTGLDAVRLAGVRRADSATHVVTFEVTDRGEHTVEVHSTRSAPRQLTCGAATAQPMPVHRATVLSG
ncbi:sucrase ferredoxin [Enemella sp. A6]|uniref:sucrase ferredoxin n=1 Tax=Enemella sp. A6 TaxID=3440152 RepID=UPI003EBC2558